MPTPQGADARIDDIRNDLQSLRNDIVKLAQELPSMLSDVRDDSLHAARERVDRMKKNVDASLSQLSQRGREAAKAMNEVSDNMVQGIEESFHARPITTIAVALGVGYVLGSVRKR
jgi:ElaB/YqjD/DUF883 family membrane-anchored ribosome-binding protein